MLYPFIVIPMKILPDSFCFISKALHCPLFYFFSGNGTLFFVLFYSGLIVCIEGVARGLRGGCKGVAWGFR